MHPDDTPPIYNDEPNVIAEAHGYQLYSDGVVDDGNCPLDLPGIAALLSDLYRRVREDLSSVAKAGVEAENRLNERIEAVEKGHAHKTKMNSAGFKNVIHHIDRLQDRVSALEGTPLVSPEAVARLQERLAAVEREAKVLNLRIGNDSTHSVTVAGRLDALEARQQDEIPGEPFPESWKQDEAGEGEDKWGQWDSGYKAGRRELAREQIEKLRKTAPVDIGEEFRRLTYPHAPVLALIRWLEREFGGESNG